MNFNDLVNAIHDADRHLASNAKKAVNVSLTLRNWLIGRYISEYELNGADRAEYGSNIFGELSSKLADISNCARRQLYKYLRFYRVYPQIVGTSSTQFSALLPASISARIERVPAAKSSGAKIVCTSSALFTPNVIEKLSYSHFEKLFELEDDTKRAFYMTECLLGQWTVKELKRQIGSLYYERSGLSLDKKKLSVLAQQNAEQTSPGIPIRDPYVFEFLGLKPEDVMSESHLEGQLMRKLEEFVLELGHGFCFEARQKRILIGDEHYFIDLVFYHRVLKCHVLIELKVEEFSQENIGQLNTYVSWYRKNMMTEGDNPPVGILLCTGKNESLVEYALAGMDNNLFVSKYLLELPKKEEMQAFIEQQMQEILGDAQEE
jgi:predicted nuclease of restriction endonuclease-like (RecB) superfamily